MTTTETKLDRASSYYGACWDAFQRGNMSVYYDSDDDTYQAASGGFTGWDNVEVATNVDASDFGSGAENMSRDEFIAMCIDAFGIDVPTGIELA
jgi:hypothetical protein